VNQHSVDRAQFLLRRNAEDSRRPIEFHLLDRDWTLLAGVFSPVDTPVTELFTRWIPFPATSFLEIGSGTGVTAVSAALAGCLAVTASDITPEAVENTRANARRHGVADRVRIVLSDMFEGFALDDQYDMIFWNSNFVEVPEDVVNASPLHHAFFDPGYRSHRAFLHHAPDHLTPGGRLLLGFSDLGNHERLEQLARECGLTISTLRSLRRELEVPVTFQLLEFAPDRVRS
jgi:release factor glutamine methyltransferase